MTTFHVDDWVSGRLTVIGNHLGQTIRNSIIRDVVEYWISNHPEVEKDLKQLDKILGRKKRNKRGRPANA